MLVVSDTTPLLYLARVGRLDLLCELYVALVRHADLLLLDDAAGRRAAGELGVAVRGTLGVLVTAKAAGILVAVAPVIAALLAEGFRASGAVVERALRASGEGATSVGST